MNALIDICNQFLQGKQAAVRHLYMRKHAANGLYML